MNQHVDRLPLRVVILSHNEETNLPRCIASVAACAEVVVVDDGSTDDSAGIARRLGATVVEHPFTSFADQRNWAMDQLPSAHAWTLHLDADEVMTPALTAELFESLPLWTSSQVGQIARKVMLEDRWLRFSTDYPVFVPRLLHRQGPRFTMRGHGETVDLTSGQSILLRHPVLHYPFSKGWEDWWSRHQRYARAEAARIRRGLPLPSLASLLARDRTTRRAALRAWSYRLPGRPVLRFLYAYVARGGFLDGRPGWTFCRAMAGYERLIDEALRSAS